MLKKKGKPLSLANFGDDCAKGQQGPVNEPALALSVNVCRDFFRSRKINQVLQRGRN